MPDGVEPRGDWVELTMELGSWFRAKALWGQATRVESNTAANLSPINTRNRDRYARKFRIKFFATSNWRYMSLPRAIAKANMTSD